MEILIWIVIVLAFVWYLPVILFILSVLIAAVYLIIALPWVFWRLFLPNKQDDEHSRFMEDINKLKEKYENLMDH